MKFKHRVPEIRFKGFSGEWERKKLDEIATFFSGGTPTSTNKEYYSGNIAFIGSGNIKSEKVQQYITQEALESSSAKMIKKGDLLYALYGATSGEVAISKMNGAVNQAVLCIRTQENKYFLNLWLLGKKKTILSTYLQGGQGNLSANIIKNLKPILPKLTEQTKIGNYFQHLDRLIEEKAKKEQKLKSLKKAMLQKMFPKEGATTPEIRFKGFSGEWERKQLGEIGSIGMNKRIFKHQTLDKGEIPFFKIGTFGKKPNAYISRKVFDEYKSKYPYPQKGDLLISASGSIGKIVEYTGKDEYYQDSNIVWLMHDNNIVNSYLKQFYSIVKWNGLEGSTIQRLYNKNILTTSISMPTKTEQTKIGNYFQKLDSLINLQHQELEKLKNLKKAFLSKMFV